MPSEQEFNKLFHHGLEWPLRERIAFKDRIERDGWPATWFEISGKGNGPWMISITDAFVDHSIDILIALADVFGEYIRKEESALAI
jgi:hypothetical protein